MVHFLHLPKSEVLVVRALGLFGELKVWRSGLGLRLRGASERPEKLLYTSFLTLGWVEPAFMKYKKKVFKIILKNDLKKSYFLSVGRPARTCAATRGRHYTAWMSASFWYKFSSFFCLILFGKPSRSVPNLLFQFDNPVLVSLRHRCGLVFPPDRSARSRFPSFTDVNQRFRTWL